VSRRFDFGTKAETLLRLAPLVEKSAVPAFSSFTVGRWCADPASVLEEVTDQFARTCVIVRSSALAEDGGASALAGAFESVGNVDGADSKALTAAIERVAASYRRDDRAVERDDQIIVQEMITDVLVSGVLFTQDMSTGAPYYVINYDD
jgi:phosphoenolpyruvate synthase/pyruvate phosphate dikinase